MLHGENHGVEAAGSPLYLLQESLSDFAKKEPDKHVGPCTTMLHNYVNLKKVKRTPVQKKCVYFGFVTR